ncbi:MAG TPA: chitobiase/beta-hexosaminidase C-terminal domain-containing protein, partial [Pyrinomonadaceae bacterium]
LVPFSGAVQISANTEGAYVLVLRGGTVWAWGHNFYGQLGDGTTENRSTPAQVEDLMFVKEIGAGGHTSIALKTNGTVWTWGSNEFGSLGIGSITPATSSRPVQVPTLSGITAISAGTSHLMALKSDGTVWIWGQNSRGELGIGTQDFNAYPLPLKVPGLTNVVRIIAGDGISYAVKSDGTVFGWGTTISGRLGDGTMTGEAITSPIELPLLKNTIAAGPGLASTVVLKQDATLWSFGSNFLGRLGRGIVTEGGFPVPTQIPNLLGKTVSAGYAHTLVTLPDGTVKAFGGNDAGQLGQGTSDFGSHSTPLLVPGVTGVFATAAGSNASFALIGNSSTGGTIKAWGGNTFGMLGIGSLASTSVPVVVGENLTVAKPIFSAPAGILTGTQVFVACGTPGAVIHYTTNGADPTESDPVVVSGTAVAVDHSLTLKAKAFKSGFTSSAVKSAGYTVVASEPLQLLLDESGPAVDQAAALDWLAFMRDPFPVVNLGDLLNQGSDHNTRVLVFLRNLQLSQGETAAAVIVNLVDSNQSFDVFAEQVVAIPNTDLVQVTFRLPNNLASGTCTVRVKHQLRTSNAGTIRIKP